MKIGIKNIIIVSSHILSSGKLSYIAGAQKDRRNLFGIGPSLRLRVVDYNPVSESFKILSTSTKGILRIRRSGILPPKFL